MALFFAATLGLRPWLLVDPDAPVVDRVAVERLLVTERGFAAQIRSEGPEPLTIAQVQVDGAFWLFSQEPVGALRRAETAWIRVEFPWVAGETHVLRLITATGVVIETAVDVALPSPVPSGRLLARYTLLGLCVGLIPVALGMLCYPIVRSLQRVGLEFVLALTIGLLVFLWFDMSIEGLEFAQEASAIFQSGALVWIPMVLTFAALAALSSRSRRGARGTRVAALIAGGIGLHNLGEGLAIGASLANSELALGAFLIVGFTLHNVTEGLGVVAPLAGERSRWFLLGGLALLAGLPAVPGIWVGAFLLAPHWAAIFYGVGAGAVAQVVVELDHFLGVRVRPRDSSRFSPTSAAGYLAGAAVMYLTALLIPL